MCEYKSDPVTNKIFMAVHKHFTKMFIPSKKQTAKPPM